MEIEDKKWAFTELLGLREDVEKAIQELKENRLIHGAPCSCEDKEEKRLVQYYECNKDVAMLTVQEQEQYNEIARRCHVYFEFSFMGNVVLDFPSDKGNDFCLKYWEWWMR